MTDTTTTFFPKYATIASYKPSDPASGSPAAEEAAFAIRAYWTYHNEESYCQKSWRSGWISTLLLPACIPAWLRNRTPTTLGELDTAQSWFIWNATPDRIPCFFSADRTAEELWIPDGQKRAWAHSPPLPSDRQFYRGSEHPHAKALEDYWVKQYEESRGSRRSLPALFWNYGPAWRLSMNVHPTMATLGDVDDLYHALANALYLDPPEKTYFQSIAQEGEWLSLPLTARDEDADEVGDVKRVLVAGVEPPSWLSGKPELPPNKEDLSSKGDELADKV